eukprot:jgi/Mesvir1/17321/Mv07714-RA.1
MASTEVVVFGIPASATSVYINDFFGDAAGFISSRVRYDKRQRRLGFLEFTTADLARGAIDRFNGKFMKDAREPLTVELARISTTEHKRPRDNSPTAVVLEPPVDRTNCAQVTTRCAEANNTCHRVQGLGGSTCSAVGWLGIAQQTIVIQTSVSVQRPCSQHASVASQRLRPRPAIRWPPTTTAYYTSLIANPHGPSVPSPPATPLVTDIPRELRLEGLKKGALLPGGITVVDVVQHEWRVAPAGSLPRAQLGGGGASEGGGDGRGGVPGTLHRLSGGGGEGGRELARFGNDAGRGTVQDASGRPPSRLPTFASETLYVNGLPDGVTLREAAHAFRQHKGYVSMRLVHKDSVKNHGQIVTLGFAQYKDAESAKAAMDSLQGSPILKGAKWGNNSVSGSRRAAFWRRLSRIRASS